MRWHPAEHVANVLGARDEDGRISVTSGAEFHRDGLASHFSRHLEDFPHGITRAGPEIENAIRELAAFQGFERRDVRASKI